MKGQFHMTKIISTIFISYMGWKLTGYDFFILSSLISFSIDIYKGFNKILKRYNKYTKDKTVVNSTK